MRKLKKFFRDTWKILLAIFIIVTTLLYSLIFDGSETPFLVSFMSAFVILFLKSVKDTIIFAKQFSYLKKSGFFTNDSERIRNIYKQCREKTHANIFSVVLSGAWLAYLIFSLHGGDWI